MYAGLLIKTAANPSDIVWHLLQTLSEEFEVLKKWRTSSAGFGLTGLAAATGTILQEPIKDPARLEWHEVTRVAHYYLSVNAMTRPMQVQEDEASYGGSSS